MSKKPINHNATDAPPGVAVVRQGGGGVPLVCVSPMGEAGDRFGPLSSYLPEKLPVIGIQSTHVPIDTLLRETVEEQAGRFLGLLRYIQPQGPYRLIGFSFGAHVVCEMARRLIEENESVEYLGIIDTAPADKEGSAALRSARRGLSMLGKIPSRAAMAFRARRLAAGGLAALLTDRLRVRHEGPGMSIRERLEAIRLGVREYGGREVQVLDGGGGAESKDKALRLQSARTVTACKRAIAAYQMVPVAARVYLYASCHERSPKARASLERQWRKFAGEGLDTHWFECGHMELLREPAVGEVARAMACALAELDGSR